MAKLFITLVGNDLNVTQDTGGTTNLERYPRSAVKGVTPLKLNTKPAQGTIKYSSPSAAFTLGETITGGTSGATAVVAGFRGSVGFVLSSVVGTFTKGETITGGTSSSTATVVSATYNPTVNEWTYPYDVMTVLQVDFIDGARLNIELQDVSNQGTWNTGNQAGLNAASAAFNTWLNA